MANKLEIYVGESTPKQRAAETAVPHERVLEYKLFHQLADPDFDGWPEFVTVKWEGMETGNCAAAINPQPREQLDRYLAGCVRREESALGIVEIQGSFSVPGAPSGVGVQSLPSDVEPELVESLSEVDKDFALSVRSNNDVPWKGLVLTAEGDTGSRLRPLLVDALGNPVVAVWHPSRHLLQRWYILPPGCNWKPLADWLVHQAIPEYVSQAANRVYELAAIEDSFLTNEEREAKANLGEFEQGIKEQRESLENARLAAQDKANEIRIALLYKSADELKQAVATVLRSCGFDVEDLDDSFGEPLSSDLLASRDGKYWLIESKWAGGHPKEDEIASVVKHGRTWEELGRPEKLEHAVVVLNHHSKRPPAARPSVPFSRKEFVGVLPSYGVSVISSMAVCRWWAAEDCESLVSAVTGPIGQHGG